MKKLLLIIVIIALSGVQAFAGPVLKLGSTTSTENSGLFDYLLPIFKQQTGITVHVIAVGTGAAIELGKRGDVDAVLCHAKSLELQAVKEGYFVDRHDVMYNDFIVVGPPNDPARIAQASSALEAMKRIAQSGQLFVSRGDHSGTDIKEKSLWKQLGLMPKGAAYMEASQGMGGTLRIASEKRAYTLTDRGTFLSMQDKLDLKILYQGDPALFNQYGVMAVNPQKHNFVRFKAAETFVKWMISLDGQATIAKYKDRHGNVLFFPNAK